MTTTDKENDVTAQPHGAHQKTQSKAHHGVHKEKQSRVFWTEDEYNTVLAEAKRMLDTTGRFPTPDEAQRAALPKDRWRPFGPANSSAITKFKKLFRAAYGSTNPKPRAMEQESAKHLERQPSPATITRFSATPANNTPTLHATMTAAAVHSPEPSAERAFDVLAGVLSDRIEDAAVDLLVSIIDRTLTHPAVIKAVHGLVQSSFAKEVQTTLDKTATWSEKTVLSRLPRVLVVGLRAPEQERATEAYGKTLALRFWDEKQQSKGLLKQLIHGSQDIVVLPARVSHSAMQLIKARAKRPPAYVTGYGAEAMNVLEEVAKQAIANSDNHEPRTEV